MLADQSKLSSQAKLSMAALGVVFGDIGTSPLYAFRESFLGLAHLEVNQAHIFGVLSMITWSLIIVISIKYLLVVMRADNQGEGGIIALVSLLHSEKIKTGFVRKILVFLGLFGAALLFGDGAITPAISVLSALEGLELATTAFKPMIIPLTIAILMGIFAVQRLGTSKIGAVFGPVMIVWFTVLALLGLGGIWLEPQILQALNPYWAFIFLSQETELAFIVLGTVFLAVTGGETLYADMGHFGAQSIKRVWFIIVFPALLINYFGQGALVLSDHSEITHPFFHLAPSWGLLPLVFLATIATIIASQAVISGVFSLTRQAMQLGQLPRMRIIQTDGTEFGQVYVPVVNAMLLIATIGIVLFFKTSSNLASAYGLAIAMDMVITTILTVYILGRWGWSFVFLWILALVFLSLDGVYLGANILKFFDGGWMPTLAGFTIFGLMLAWSRGRKSIQRNQQYKNVQTDEFLPVLKTSSIARTDGTAIFLTSELEQIPVALLHQMKHNKALHKTVILLHIEVLPVASVDENERCTIQELDDGFYGVLLKFGFNERINLPDQLSSLAIGPFPMKVSKASFYLTRESISVSLSKNPLEILWKRLFIFMNRNASLATAYYGIPTNRVVEIGTQTKI